MNKSGVTDVIVDKIGKKRSAQRSESSNLTATRVLFERMKLMDYLNNLTTVHCAGSKGKGSTALYTAELLRRTQQFKSVAMFTSPHLVDIRERIQINGKLVDEDLFASLYSKFEAEYAEKCEDYFKQQELEQEKYIRQQEEVEKLYQQQQQQQQQQSSSPSSSSATTASSSSSSSAALRPRTPPPKVVDRYNFFRSMFLFSVYLMRHLSVDAAVIEVGIGGRLDPTNIIPPPSVCLVTALGMDHCEILGNTIEEIATEKAGIFKPDSFCISAPQSDFPQTRQVLEKIAGQNKTLNLVEFPDVSDFFPSSFSSSSQKEEEKEEKEGMMKKKGNENDDGEVEAIFNNLAKERGAHQVENVVLAIAASRIILQRRSKKENSVLTFKGPLTAEEIDVIQSTKMPGRSQCLRWNSSSASSTSTSSSRLVFLDGAHTVESIRRALQWGFEKIQEKETEQEEEEEEETKTKKNKSKKKTKRKAVLIFATSRAPIPQLSEIYKFKNQIGKIVFVNIPEIKSGQQSAEKCCEAWKNSVVAKQREGENEDEEDQIEVVTAEDIKTALSNENVVGGPETSTAPIFVTGSLYTVGATLQFIVKQNYDDVI